MIARRSCPPLLDRRLLFTGMSFFPYGDYGPTASDKRLEIVPISGQHKTLFDERCFIFFHFLFSLWWMAIDLQSGNGNDKDFA